MIKIPEQASEVVRAAGHPRELFDTALTKAKSTVIGSGVISEEIGRTLQGYRDIAGNAINTALHTPKALGKLFTEGHRREAIGEMMGTVSDGFRTFGSGLDIVGSTTRIPAAFLARGVETGKEVLKLPFKGAEALLRSPFTVWNAGDRMVDSLFNSTGNISKALSRGMDNLTASGRSGAMA